VERLYRRLYFLKYKTTLHSQSQRKKTEELQSGMSDKIRTENPEGNDRRETQKISRDEPQKGKHFGARI
jgi:hypothetical protein